MRLLIASKLVFGKGPRLGVSAWNEGEGEELEKIVEIKDFLKREKDFASLKGFELAQGGLLRARP